MKQFKSLGLINWVFITFSTIWCGLLFLDYYNKHPLYWLSIEHYKYWNLTLFFAGLGILLSALYNRLGPFKRAKKIYLNGLVILGIILIIVIAVTVSFNHYWNAPLTLKNYLHICVLSITTISGGLSIVLAGYSAGSLIRKQLIRPEDKSLTLVLGDIAIGLLIFTLLLFLAGALEMLTQWVVLGILAFMIVINYRDTWYLLKNIFWNQIHLPKDANFWTMLIAFSLIVMVTLNFLYSLAPFPLGFDARNLYVMLSKNIAESGSLLAGYQPYAWSLAMSTGYIAFQSPPITLFLSALGGYLSLFVLYDLLVNHFKINLNYSLGAMFLFAGTPAVVNHWIVEYKIDLALLFIQLSIVSLFLYWRFMSNRKESASKILKTKEDYFFLGWISVLLGFSLSIKVLSVFLIFGLFLAIWLLTEDFWGLVGISCLALGLILIIGLDEISGLRRYHTNPELTGKVTMAIGAIFLLVSAVRNFTRWFANSWALLFSFVLTILVFSPWLVKNYLHVGSRSITEIIAGVKPNLVLNNWTFERNYINLKNQKENKGQ